MTGRWKRSTAQGRGLATEAVIAMKAHLVERHRVRTFFATVEADHAASIALLGRVGMRPASGDEAELPDLTARERLFVG